MTKVMKCDTPTCHRRTKLDEHQQAIVNEFKAVHGVGRVGVLCPNCVELALDDEERFTLDMEDWEIVMQVASKRPPWRVVFQPPE